MIDRQGRIAAVQRGPVDERFMRVEGRAAPVRRARASLLVALVMGARCPAAAAAKDCPQTTLGDIEDEVMCPVCGTPLGLASESPQAQRERAYIERLIAQCRSKDQVKRALVAEFGDSVLALPGDEGDDERRRRARLRRARARHRAGRRRHRVRRRSAGGARGGTAPAAPWRRPRAPALDDDMERYDL